MSRVWIFRGLGACAVRLEAESAKPSPLESKVWELGGEDSDGCGFIGKRHGRCWFEHDGCTKIIVETEHFILSSKVFPL